MHKPHWSAGPWAIEHPDIVYSVPDQVPDEIGICQVFGPNQGANARLIAAAPDMAETLHDLLDLLDDISSGGYNVNAYQEVKVARAALAKAEGCAA